MRKIVILSLMLALSIAYAGCASPAVAEGLTEHTLRVDGEERFYLVYDPDGRAAERPLVLDMHGWGGTAYEQLGASGFTAIAEEEGIIVVYPQATGEELLWGLADDVSYIEAVLDAVSADYPVDESRIYATGFSAGGFMAHYLGGALSDRIAAVASVGGLIPDPDFAALGGAVTDAADLIELALPPEPIRPVPVMMIHGTNDEVVPYAGVEPTLAVWADWNGCGEPVMDFAEEAGPPVTRYEDCADDARMILIPFDDQDGHIIPREAGGLDAPEVIWAFFSTFVLT
ncbi:MAG: hypothetical protein GYB64_12700 [Chloroflexi bacterium]|nr:hypothetical protein [Chloroflexota bacterium]